MELIPMVVCSVKDHAQSVKQLPLQVVSLWVTQSHMKFSFREEKFSATYSLKSLDIHEQLAMVSSDNSGVRRSYL